MSKTATSIFFERIKRVCIFDPGVYLDVRHSFFSASFIVLLVALSHGIGGIIRAKINNWDAKESFVFAVQGEIVFWVVQSLVYFTVAKLLFHKPVKLAEVLSSIGYAIFPGILIIAASLLPLIELSIPLLIILAVYRLATCTVALQQLLNLKPFVAFMLVVLGSGTGFLCLGFFIKLSNAMVN